MKANVLVVVTSIVLPTVTLKAQLKATTLTKRAAELTRLDVHPQAKHPRSEGSQMGRSKHDDDWSCGIWT